MGKIIRNGIEFSGTRDTANNINYDGTLSGLNANTVQEAIDEVNNKLNNSGSDLSILQWYIDNGWLPAIPAEGEVPVNLEDCSWNMIQQLVAADTFKNYYKVGDTKSITLSSGEVVYMQVASINNGEGDAGAWYPKGTVDFISKDCLQTKYLMNGNAWNDCELRKTLNDTIINNLPVDLKDTIVEKTHNYYIGANSHVDYSDKLWLPTVYELTGTNSNIGNEKVNCNIMYSIFSDDSSRIKCLGNNGTTNHWYTSSLYINPSTNIKYFIFINTNGAQTWNTETSRGVPLCFRVG